MLTKGRLYQALCLVDKKCQDLASDPSNAWNFVNAIRKQLRRRLAYELDVISASGTIW